MIRKSGDLLGWNALLIPDQEKQAETLQKNGCGNFIRIAAVLFSLHPTLLTLSVFPFSDGP